MVLDHEKARTFDCNTCDYQLQFKRNCTGKYDKAQIIVNQEKYEQCPRAIISNHREERYLVDMYFECRENKNYPEPGSIYNQTAFTVELFDYCDSIVNIYKNRKHQEHLNQMKKQSTENKSKKK